MPLLGHKYYRPKSPPEDSADWPYSIAYTNERFQRKGDYDDRLKTYNQAFWTCQCSGRQNLTYEEALKSEHACRKKLAEEFPPYLEQPILELVHHNISTEDEVVQEVHNLLRQRFFVDEKIRITKADLSGVVEEVKVDCAPSPNSDKENATTSTKLSYNIRMTSAASPKKLVRGVPSEALSRQGSLPNDNLLRLFVRSNAFRNNYQIPKTPWQVDAAQRSRFGIKDKFASLFASPKCTSDKHASLHRQKARKSIAPTLTKAAKPAAATPSASVHKAAAAPSDAEIVLDSSSSSSSSDDDTASSPFIQRRSGLSPRGTAARKQTQTKPPAKSKSSAAEQKAAPVNRSLSSQSAAKKKKSLAMGRQSSNNALPEAFRRQKKLSSGGRADFVVHVDSSADEQKPTTRRGRAAQRQTPAAIVARLKSLHKAGKVVAFGTQLSVAARRLTDEDIDKCGDEFIRDRLRAKKAAIAEKAKVAQMSDAQKKQYLLDQKMQRRKERLDKLRLTQPQLPPRPTGPPLFAGVNQFSRRLGRMRERLQKAEDTHLNQRHELPKAQPVELPATLPAECFADATMVAEFCRCFAGLLGDASAAVTTFDLLDALVAGARGFPVVGGVLVIFLKTILQDKNTEDYQIFKMKLHELPVSLANCSEMARLCLRPTDKDLSDSSDSEDDDDLPRPPSQRTPSQLHQVLSRLETCEVCELSADDQLMLLCELLHRLLDSHSLNEYIEASHNAFKAAWAQKSSIMSQAAVTSASGSTPQRSLFDAFKPLEQPAANSPLAEVDLSADSGAEGESATEGDGGEEAEKSPDKVEKMRRRRQAMADEKLRKAEREKADREAARREREEQRRRRELDRLAAEGAKKRADVERVFRESLAVHRQTNRLDSLGTDRNHSRYWIFGPSTPGVFVERGWADANADYACKLDGTGDSMGSVLERDLALLSCSSQSYLSRCDVETLPEAGANLWFRYTRVEELESLRLALNQTGFRESKLKEALNRRWKEVVAALPPPPPAANDEAAAEPAESMAVDEAEEGEREVTNGTAEPHVDEPAAAAAETLFDSAAAFKQELLSTQERLARGDLGGVDDVDEWRARLDTAVDLPLLGACLLQVQASVIGRFRCGMMRTKATEQPEAATAKAEQPEAESPEEEPKTKKPQHVTFTERWAEEVKGARTLSRLQVLLAVLDHCVDYSKSTELQRACKVCKRVGVESDEVILCDVCNGRFHLRCLRPPLRRVPRGSWFCAVCKPERTTARLVGGQKVRGRQSQSDESEEEEDDEAPNELAEMRAKRAEARARRRRAARSSADDDEEEEDDDESSGSDDDEHDEEAAPRSRRLRAGTSNGRIRTADECRVSLERLDQPSGGRLRSAAASADAQSVEKMCETAIKRILGTRLANCLLTLPPPAKKTRSRLSDGDGGGADDLTAVRARLADYASLEKFFDDVRFVLLRGKQHYLAIENAKKTDNLEKLEMELVKIEQHMCGDVGF